MKSASERAPSPLPDVEGSSCAKLASDQEEGRKRCRRGRRGGDGGYQEERRAEQRRITCHSDGYLRTSKKILRD